MTMANISAEEIQRINPKGVVDSRIFGFSQGVIAPADGHYVFVSGQYAGDENGVLVGDTMAAQMKQSFLNLKRVIEASGAKPGHVTQIRVLVVDHKESYLELFHREVTALFGDELPASTLIPVPRLALDGMLFEIEATVFVAHKK